MKAPGNWICDCLSRLRRMSHSQKLGAKETPIFLYNVFMRYVRDQIRNGVNTVFLVFDKGVPADKLATSKERAESRKDDVKKAKSVVYPEDCRFLMGRLLYFERKAPEKDSKESGWVVSRIEETVNLEGILNHSRLRSEFLDWMLDRLQEESRAYPATVTFVVDCKTPSADTPSIISAGKRVQAKHLANNWLEADHAIGKWAFHCMDQSTPAHTVVWAVDGDLLIVLLWMVYEYRKRKNTHTAKTQNLGLDHPNRGYCTEMKPFAQDETKSEPTTEPRVVFVWQAQEESDSFVIDINEAVSSLINRRITPVMIALSAMLTKNDYVKKSDVTPEVGAAAVFEFLRKQTGNPFIEEFATKSDEKSFLETFLPKLCVGRGKKPLAKLMSIPEGKERLKKSYASIVRSLLRWQQCGCGSPGSANEAAPAA